jgi:hypothetical protein
MQPMEESPHRHLSEFRTKNKSPEILISILSLLNKIAPSSVSNVNTVCCSKLIVIPTNYRTTYVVSGTLPQILHSKPSIYLVQ